MAQRGPARCAFVVLGALAGCASPPDPWDQLQPGSPCYEVDLRDGIGTVDELRTTFDCLDHHGHLRSLHPTRAALDADADAGWAAAVEALEAGRATLQGAEAVPALELPDPAVGDLFLEVLSGVPGDTVGAPAPPVDAMPWAGTGPAVERLVASLRDQPPAVSALASVLRHPSLEEALVATVRAADEPQGPFVAPLLHDAAAGALAGDPDGTLTEAWLDSWVVDPLGALPRSFFPLQLLTADPGWRNEVVAHVAAHDDLGEVPAAIAWLARVDPDGAPLAPGRTSALARILALLDKGTEPVTCTVGIEPFALDLSFDDLTVRLLRIVAGMEPGTLGSAASVWSTLTDNVVADAALDAAVASGACPAFDDAAQEGLDALDLLTADEAAPLLELAVPLLDTTERHQALGHLADVFGAIGAPAAIADADALAAAVGPTDGAARAARGLQGLASPVPGGEPALRHLLDGLAFALTGEPGGGGPPAVVAYPWIREVAADADVRRGLGRLATTWADPATHTTEITDHLPEESSLRATMALVRPLATEEVVAPALEALGRPGVVSALLATEPSDEGTAAPLVALDGALRGGTFADAWAWFEEAVDTAGR